MSVVVVVVVTLEMAPCNNQQATQAWVQAAMQSPAQLRLLLPCCSIVLTAPKASAPS